MKSSVIIIGWCAVFIITTLILAPIPAGAESTINKNRRGLAIKGYDPVAYFTLSKPVKGKKEFEYNWQDAQWRFSSAEHLNLFKSDPEKYAPQYGGY
jgi:YHS domain-containing protein